MSEKPEPPFPKQNIDPPGLESEMDPEPKYLAEGYAGSGKLKDRVALITGGDSGIGRSVAVLFAREGADVAIVYLEEEQEDAEVTRDAVANEGGKALLIPGDVRDAAFCESAVQSCVDELGRLDVLVNNAAYQKHREGLHAIDAEQWDRTFRTNIYGYFQMARAAEPHLREGSAIINTGSITGLDGSKHLLDYASTKGAIHAFTKSLAQNLVEKGIRVNCVAPGPVWTPLNPAERDYEGYREFGGSVPMGRPAQPEEIAPAYVFFASKVDSGFVTGQVLAILGGETT